MQEVVEVGFYSSYIIAFIIYVISHFEFFDANPDGDLVWEQIHLRKGWNIHKCRFPG
ncbi:hypothetical protein PSCICN_45710 [Pseudomonas cichorii]|nr:hypothetical protein PSCICN_45710 [Pseudomonas cichorii]